jgi:hypothetical protein
MSKAPINVEPKTNNARSFCPMIAMSPMIKAEIPEAIPTSIVSARAGLTVMSFNMVPPAGTDLYSRFVNDIPTKNNTGIATINPSDHQPKGVLGRTVIRMFITSSDT